MCSSPSFDKSIDLNWDVRGIDGSLSLITNEVTYALSLCNTSVMT